MWDMDNVIGVANEAVKHTGLVVQPWDLQTTPQVNDRSGPTPSALAKMVESNNLMPNIKRWSKQNAPNEARAAAPASITVDMTRALEADLAVEPSKRASKRLKRRTSNFGGRWGRFLRL